MIPIHILSYIFKERKEYGNWSKEEKRKERIDKCKKKTNEIITVIIIIIKQKQ
jgi:hypothetical protein